MAKKNSEFSPFKNESDCIQIGDDLTMHDWLILTNTTKQSPADHACFSLLAGKQRMPVRRQ